MRTPYYFILACALLLTACGTSDDEDTSSDVTRFTEQEVTWETCNSVDLEGLEDFTEPLGERLECATLKTPLDWNDLERDEINLGVLRIKAADPEARKGAVLINPGGPGGDSFGISVYLSYLFSNPETEDFTGAPNLAADAFLALSDSYDVVGFSPRGVGGGFQLFCGSNKLAPPSEFYTVRTEENVQALLEGAELEAEACLNNPLYKYISTEQTVRDMDLIRAVLGDEKLNYLGYSYGSWLGAWYAKRFPERAGNIVLSANTDFAATFQVSFGRQPEGLQRAFEEVALPFIARNNATFGLGESVDELQSFYQALPPGLKFALFVPAYLYVSDSVPDIAVNFVAVEGVNAVLQGTEGELDPDAFFEGVEGYTYAEDADIDEAAREAALFLADAYLFYLEITSEPFAVELPPEAAVFDAILCNDSPWIEDPSYYARAGNEADEAYPLFGGALTAQACAFWTPPTASMPEVPSDMPPVLMVQSELDAPTPVEGALNAFNSLPNAKMVFVENELTHGTFPYSACVDARVAAYLLDGTLPDEKVTTCEAKPLPGEEQVYPVDAPTPTTQQVSTFSVQAMLAEPETPQERVKDLIQETISENARGFLGHR